MFWFLFIKQKFVYLCNSIIGWRMQCNHVIISITWVTLSYGGNSSTSYLSHMSALEWLQDGLHLCWIYLQLWLIIMGHISHWFNYPHLNGFVSVLHRLTVGLCMSLWLILEEPIVPESSNFTKSQKKMKPFCLCCTRLC